MKAKLAILVVIFLCIASIGKTSEHGVIRGDSMTTLGEFSITPALFPLEISGTTFETHLLKYENAKRPIRIGVETKKKCVNFIVKGPNFEIEYICDKGVFGAKPISELYQEIKENVNMVVVDKHQLDCQKVISMTEKSNEELLSLIACYLPMLIREQYRMQI